MADGTATVICLKTLKSVKLRITCRDSALAAFGVLAFHHPGRCTFTGAARTSN